MTRPDDSLEVQVERFLAAIREPDAPAALRLLAQHPEIARANLWTACAIGDAAQVAAAIARAPALANSRHEPSGATPLIYVGGSPLPPGEAVPAQYERCAEQLLAAGADPNGAILFDRNDPRSRIPALYYACVTDKVGVARLLLERGAEPNDGESVFHAAELDRRECLELLVAHGANLSGTSAGYGNTPLSFLAGYRETDAKAATVARGMQWLLEHGADPNVPSAPGGETALHRVILHGRSTAIVDLLIAHGADVNLPRADGRTPYVLAVRAGNTAAIERLRAGGAAAHGLTPADELVGAAMLGDGGAARAVLASHPELLARLSAEDRSCVAHAAIQGRLASVRLMAELGFDLAWEEAWAGTPLHHAAWHGQVAMVRTLIALGAPIDARDREFGSSALGWAAHGSRHCRPADDDYAAVIEALIGAGATAQGAVNREGEGPGDLASPRVKALLKARGFAL